MEANVYGSGDVARLVGLPRWRLLYLIDKGRVPGPARQVPLRLLLKHRVLGQGPYSP